MTKNNLVYIIISMVLTISAGTIFGQESITPPIAKIILKAERAHGDVRLDPYAWLRDKDNPEVMKHLQAENEYTESVMASTKSLQDKLFEEMKGRIPADDESLPYKLGDYYYYTRNEEGKSYSITASYLLSVGSIVSIKSSKKRISSQDVVGSHPACLINKSSIRQRGTFASCSEPAQEISFTTHRTRSSTSFIR